MLRVVEGTEGGCTEISLVGSHPDVGLQADDGTRAQERDGAGLVGPHQQVGIPVGIEVKATRQ